MADLSELKEKLVKVEKALNSKALPEVARPALEKKQAELKKDIAEAEESTRHKIVKPRAEKKPTVKAKTEKKKIPVVKQKKSEFEELKEMMDFKMSKEAKSLSFEKRFYLQSHAALVEANAHTAAKKLGEILKIYAYDLETIDMVLDKKDRAKIEKTGEDIAEKLHRDPLLIINFFYKFLESLGWDKYAHKMYLLLEAEREGEEKDTEKSKVYTDEDGVKYWAETTDDGKSWHVVAQAEGGPASEAYDDWLTNKKDAEEIAEMMAKGEGEFAPHKPAKEKESKSGLRGYAKSIVEATGCSAKDAEEVEEIMRNDIFHSTLDWLSKSEFDKGAKEGYEQLLFMRSPEGKKFMKEAGEEMDKAARHEADKKEPKPDKDDDLTECKKILEAANYDVKSKTVKTKDGKKKITTREPRPDRTIITDRTKSIFTTITKAYASEEEKEANKELLDTVDSVKELFIKIMNSLDKLVGEKNVDKIKKIKELLNKLV